MGNVVSIKTSTLIVSCFFASLGAPTVFITIILGGALIAGNIPDPYVVLSALIVSYFFSAIITSLFIFVTYMISSMLKVHAKGFLLLGIILMILSCFVISIIYGIKQGSLTLVMSAANALLVVYMVRKQNM